MARGLLVSVDLCTGMRSQGDLRDLTPDELAAAAAQMAQGQRETRRKDRVRTLKQKFRAGTATAADRDKALAILCGMALQDLAEDADNGGGS